MPGPLVSREARDGSAFGPSSEPTGRMRATQRPMHIREFLIERYYARHEFSTPCRRSASDCEALRIEELLELAGASADELLRLPLAYTETRGAPALREAIASFYPGCSADDVLVFNAPQEAIFLA